MKQASNPVNAPVPEGSVRRAASARGPQGLDDPEWEAADALTVSEYWSGESAPPERHCEARILWSDTGLHVRFHAVQAEPPVVAKEPVLDRKTPRLWERDVCEIFIAPGEKDPFRYLEFEVAPTGEWLDLAIEHEKDERATDWDFRSGMSAVGRIGEGSVGMAVTVPWDAFGVKPEPGDIWRGNLLRAVGSGEDRGYLAWSPTLTERPDFHVPQRFGKFVFCG